LCFLSESNKSSEKSEWLRSKEKSSKKLRWIIAVFAILFILGIAGGIAAAIILTKNQHSGSSQDSAAGGGGGNLSEQDDLRINGQLDKDSPEIKKIMANPDLHKVFPGIDYTPLNGVYPECLTWPPTQNNITRDLAVMSRLTDKIRLYSNDCNQTELVINAIDLLQIDMKVWMGVWLDGNSTTNTRQFSQMYTLLDDKNHVDKYAGIAVGNEVLFAESLTEQQLMTFIDDVRTNLTKLGYKIPIGTSDLGSKWTASMAAKVDVLMANVHPFFGGVTADKAANWTWNFFQTNDVVLTDGLTPKPKAMISEVGWPTGGGTNMGSVAGIDELNKFMSDFICTENARGTEYFWLSP
jgi:exo-beta-1,3-glucanase (GH17 family)